MGGAAAAGLTPCPHALSGTGNSAGCATGAALEWKRNDDVWKAMADLIAIGYPEPDGQELQNALHGQPAAPELPT